MNDLKDKLKRKQRQIDEQIIVLDEYRNTIKFLEAKCLRLETKLSKLHLDAVSVCACGSNEYYVEQYKDVTKYYCKNCHKKISKH